MSPRARPVLVALLGALLLASVVAAPAAGANATEGNTTFAVQLRADGDARWTVTASFGLETAAERAAFETLAEGYAAGETAPLGLDAFRVASREASQVTGRTMRITEVARSTAPASAVANGTGWLTLRFTWTNFARVREDEALVVGDVFNTTSGTWLSRLAANETLVITPPADHNPFTGDGVLTERSFRWEGPQSFGAGSPAAVFTTTGTADSNGLPTAALLVGGLAALLVLVFAFAVRRDGLPRMDRGEPAAGDEGAEPPGPATEESAPAPEADDEVDVDLLSDEERVERLLERNGGRMKQANIVKETGWSNAKVSQLLSAMAEEDRIDKLRIGRENLISFPDEDVTDAEE